MTYDQLVAYLNNYTQNVAPNTLPEFTAAIPVFIQNGEQRIYRELDFLATRSQNVTLAFTTGSRELNLALLGTTNLPLLTDTNEPLLTDTVDPILTTNSSITTSIAYPAVVQDIAAIVPVGTSTATGKRVRFRPATLDWIDNVWPTESLTASPTVDNAYFTMKTDTVAVVCPTPAAAYAAEVTGTWVPTPMSATNQQTWLGDNLPDLLFCATMVEATGYRQNFGAQSDNPQEALSWEKRYTDAKNSALELEQRRKGQGVGWQPMSPTPLAQPPR